MEEENGGRDKKSDNMLRTGKLEVICLGAGQDVGRSCVCVTLGDKSVMFDAGIHMLYSDSKRYP